MKIRKSFDKVEVTFSSVGSDVEDEIRKKYDSEGNSVYVVVGKRNLREYIESFAPGCTLQSILARCSLMPTEQKVQSLQQVNSNFGDISNMPTDLTDLLIKMNDLKRSNPDVVKMFNNGMSFDEIIKNLTDNKKEVVNNGTNESSNE